MLNSIYAKMAKDNLAKNKKIFLPFILSVILSTFMLYIMHSLKDNQGLLEMRGGRDLTRILGFGFIVICIFVFVFLFYTNSFIIKRRKKEFALYGILGMEKKHVLRVVFIENALILIISLFIGICLSILLDKIFYLILIKMLAGKAPLGFYISYKSIAITVAFISAIFLLIFVNSFRFIHLSNPIELLNAGKHGEKEPKSKLLMSIVGLIFLGVGYYISITTKNPMAALMLFFFAVVLVIGGTYILFTTGSVTLLKGLKNNKGFYYQPKNFISTSSMIYRMKQNAVGLSNIAILSTMVLVAMSTTVSLWVGIEDLVKTRYPREVVLMLTNPDDHQVISSDVIDKFLKKEGVKESERLEYRLATFPVAIKEEKVFLPKDLNNLVNPMTDFSVLNVMILDEYNRANNSAEKLESDEALIYSNKMKLSLNKLNIAGVELKIREIEKDNLPDLFANTVFDTKTMIVKDEEVFNKLVKSVNNFSEEKSVDKNYYIMFDTDKSKEENIKLSKSLITELKDNPISKETGFFMESRSDKIDDFKSMYAGLFFIGIFLSSLFLLATIIIVYYKQISEGLEDKERFEIMQKVGLDKAMIKKSINSQVLIVFFLPLLVACIHLAFAFPIISKLLNILMLSNMKLFILSCLGCILVFGFVYFVIYKITSRMYYNIIKN